MKAGVLSMQRIANYGSFLQSYGLKRMLEELGWEVQFVDFHPGKTLIPADGGNGIKRKLSKGMEVLRSPAPMKEKLKFIRYKKNYGANYYPCLGICGQMNYRPPLDLLVIGSDEVFNCVQGNPNVGFSPELFGVGSNAERVITYGASFGNTTLKKLERYQITGKVGAWLDRLDAISVRDANSGEIIRAITHFEPEYHLDPVLAYDFIGKHGESIPDVPEHHYMILYGYSGRFSEEECGCIRAYAKKRGLKIFCIGGIQGACDRFLDCDPFRVIAYFRRADCVVTDTFHGTILSVITHRPFLSLLRKTGYGNAEKLPDLLGRLGLTDRMAESLEALPELLGNPIDYRAVEQVIRGERARSYGYLNRFHL